MGSSFEHLISYFKKLFRLIYNVKVIKSSQIPLLQTLHNLRSERIQFQEKCLCSDLINAVKINTYKGTSS